MAAFNRSCPPTDLAAHLRLPLPHPPPSSDFGSVVVDLPATTISSSSPHLFPAADEHRLRRHGREAMAAANWSALLNPVAAAEAAAMAPEESSGAYTEDLAGGYGSLYDGKDSGGNLFLLQQQNSKRSSRINGASPYPAAAAELDAESAHHHHHHHHQMHHLMDDEEGGGDGSVMNYHHHQNDSSSLSTLLISADPASAAMATFSDLLNNHSLLFPPSSASTTSSSSTDQASTEQPNSRNSLHLHNPHHHLHLLRSQLQPADHQPGGAAIINIAPHTEAPSISIAANINTTTPHHGQIRNNTPLPSLLALNKSSSAESSPKISHLNHSNGTPEPIHHKKKRNHDSLLLQHMKDHASTHVKEVGGTEEHKSKHPKHNHNHNHTTTTNNNNSNSSSDEDQLKDMVKHAANCGGDSTQKPAKESTKPPETPKPEYIHVRARRGQATDSHSLAERIRREKISERMKYLQDLVPGCSKVTGKAVMLDEIINYVQSLQRQVEFLSMKLAAVNPRMEFNMESLFGREMGTRVPIQLQIPVSNSSYASTLSHQQQPLMAVQPPTVTGLSDTIMAMAASGGRHSPNPLSTPPSVDVFRDSAAAASQQQQQQQQQQQMMQTWEDELQSLVQGRQNLLSPSSCSQGQGL